MKATKTIIKALYITSFFILTTSCSKNDDSNDTSGNDPDNEVPVDPDPIPGKTSTYIADAKAIIDANCVECHSNPPTQAAPMSLETYTEVVNAVNNRNLFGRISTTNQLNVMPESGRLPNATILSIEDWIADGLLEQ